MSVAGPRKPRGARQPGARARAEHGGRAAIGFGGFLMAFLTVAHASGSGWVQAMAALVGGVLLVGCATPLWIVRRASIECVAAPSDVIAGTPFHLDLRFGAPLRVTPLDLGGEPLLVGGGPATLTVTAARRGVLTSTELLIASSFPFGLLWWSKVLKVPLPVEVHVSPRVGDPLDINVDERASRRDAADTIRRAWTGELRSLRAYRPGDARRRVHWPATAHARELVVREDEDETPREPVLLRAELPPDEEAAERRAEQLLGTLLALLRDGVSCVLETDERGASGLSRAVSGPVDARRRLARAVAAGHGLPAPSTPARSSREVIVG